MTASVSSRQIKVRNVNAATHAALKNIASHHGEPMMKVVGRKLTELIEQYPEAAKTPCIDRCDLALNGLPAKTRAAALAIAAHHGLTISEFIKPLLEQIRDSFPLQMQRERIA